MAEGVLSFPYIASNEWQFRNFAVQFVPDRTANVGGRFRVLNVFVIVSMFSFLRCVIPDGAKPVPSIKLTARCSAQFELTAVESTKAHSHHLDCFSNLSHLAHNSGVLRGLVGYRSAYVDCPNVNLSQLLSIGIDSGSLNRFVTLRHFRFWFCYVQIDSAKVQNRFTSGLSESTRFVKNRFIRAREVVSSPQVSKPLLLFNSSVVATMSRRKTPAVKNKSAPRKDPPQFSQLPLRKWFPIKEVWEDYQNVYSKMLILPPRFLSEGLLPEDKYPELWELVDFQGLRPLLFTQERYYPRMMAAVAATLRIHDGLYDDEGDGDFQLMF
ncbi:hypothetical protein PIB30_076479 [Stylosanthes scabra]|uniref:Uncharacterized protein n=1 Tax=Stylosanthes scabra TaxID=79078 RepID=A0ABU6WNL5_9FABA|nr:hypothetical protein [Stylosanthes scabra]